MAANPFAIFALPRSRTAWLSAWMTHGDLVCVHDPMIGMESVGDLVALLDDPNTGIVDTAMSFAAPIVRKLRPATKIAVVVRDIEEVRQSLIDCGLGPYGDGVLEQLNESLSAVSAMDGVLTIRYDDLSDEAVARSLWEFCIGEGFDPGRFKDFCDKDIQIDVNKRVARCESNLPAISKFVSECFEILAPVSIQEESWYDFAADGLPLIWDHYREVGSYEHENFAPNVPLIEKMADAGLIQIVTARAGSKLVGYLVFTLTPSLKALDELNAVQAPFYVKREWRGWTGVAMHREAIRLLKGKGVKRLTLRSGVKGVGERQEVLFRRLGAVEDGRMFNLWIGD